MNGRTTVDLLSHQKRDKKKQNKTKNCLIQPQSSTQEKKTKFPLGYNLPLCGFEDLMYSIGTKEENSKQKK